MTLSNPSDYNGGKWERVRTDHGWHLRLRGRNGETIVWSELYTSPETVTEALQIVFLSVPGRSGSVEMAFVDADAMLNEVDLRSAVSDD